MESFNWQLAPTDSHRGTGADVKVGRWVWRGNRWSDERNRDEDGGEQALETRHGRLLRVEDGILLDFEMRFE